MADTKQNTTFDSFQGDVVITDRAKVSPTMIKALKGTPRDVIGYVVAAVELSNPKDSGREGFFDSLIVQLTEPTTSILNEKIAESLPGQQVLVYASHDLCQKLIPALVGDDATMPLVALRPGDMIDVGKGKNPMQGWQVKIGARKARTGIFQVPVATATQIATHVKGSGNQLGSGSNSAPVAQIPS